MRLTAVGFPVGLFFVLLSSCASTREPGQVLRVSPEVAKLKVQRGDALLVCPYDRASCSGTHLKGAITLEELEARLPKLGPTQELIFFCGCAEEESAASRAGEFASRGFVHVAVVRGGILAWISAGYPVTRPEGDPK